MRVCRLKPTDLVNMVCKLLNLHTFFNGERYTKILHFNFEIFMTFYFTIFLKENKDSYIMKTWKK